MAAAVPGAELFGDESRDSPLRRPRLRARNRSPTQLYSRRQQPAGCRQVGSLAVCDGAVTMPSAAGIQAVPPVAGVQPRAGRAAAIAHYSNERSRQPSSGGRHVRRRTPDELFITMVEGNALLARLRERWRGRCSSAFRMSRPARLHPQALVERIHVLPQRRTDA